MTAKTCAERTRDTRARRAAKGLKEIRGIYVYPEFEQRLKDFAAELMKDAGKIS